MELSERMEETLPEGHDEWNELGEVMTDLKADTICKFYVCAQCWGELMQKYLMPRWVALTCSGCGPHQGFHTRRYVEAETQRNIAMSLEVTPRLMKMGVIDNPNKGKTEAQLLKELGF